MEDQKVGYNKVHENKPAARRPLGHVRGDTAGRGNDKGVTAVKTGWLWAALLLLLLAGCAQTGAGEGTMPPTAAPTPVHTATQPPRATSSPTAAPTAVPTPTPGPTAAPSAALEPTPAQTEPPATASPAPPEEDGVPDEAALDAALARAMELYWWFADTPALELDGEDTLEVDGQVYTRVLEEDMDSLASLRLKLKEVFSDELVDRLLPAGQTKFLEREGRLYVTTGGWAPSGGEIRRSWSAVSDTRLVCRVSVADGGERDLAAGERAYDLLYEKLGGHWLFTEFAPAP